MMGGHVLAGWYKDSLRHYGHVRVEDLTGLRGCFRLGAVAVLRRLELREDMRHVVRFDGSTDTVQKAAEVKRLIEETEVSFARKWTSFRVDDELMFVFADVADAVRFRMLWPEDEARN